jgi:hypothetical protein
MEVAVKLTMYCRRGAKRLYQLLYFIDAQVEQVARGAD